MFNVELDDKKLQNLAIKVDKILREEIKKINMSCSFFESRVYNIRTVGVQGDGRTYGHPAEITLKNPKDNIGRKYVDKKFNSFLERLSNRITNEVVGINKVVYVLADKDERKDLMNSLF